MLCEAEDWEEMSAPAEGMQEWLSQYKVPIVAIPFMSQHAQDKTSFLRDQKAHFTAKLVGFVGFTLSNARHLWLVTTVELIFVSSFLRQKFQSDGDFLE